MSDNKRFAFFPSEVAAASILIVWNIFAILGTIITAQRDWPRLGDPAVTAKMVFTAFFIVFLGAQIIALCVRRSPVAKASGWLPRIIALIGANVALFIVLLPQSQVSRTIEVTSSLIMAAGTGGAIYTIWYLNRSFSIFPQARVLITSGPYALVRHPLYVCEEVIVLGLSLTYQWPWGPLFAAASFLLQFPRMHFEERILLATFPEYFRYAQKTPALIPIRF